ncbi:hypothetical protein [Bacillus sp. C1]
MLKDIDYREGFGPEDSVPLGNLDIGNTFVVDTPSEHTATFKSKIDGQWEQAICIYSMFSGAKVSEFGNYSRKHNTELVIKNNSSEIISYLLTGWHKQSPPGSGIIWEQTGKIGTKHTIVNSQDPNSQKDKDALLIYITFNKFGAINSGEQIHLKNEMCCLIEPRTVIVRRGDVC